MSALGKLVREVHRRSLWQVLAAYLVFTWLLFETFEIIAFSVGLPAWVEPAALVLLVVLLPALLATASIQGGGEPEEEVAAPEPAAGGRADVGAPEAGPSPAAPSTARPPREAAPRRRPRRLGDLLTWRNTLLGGVGAFALLALVTAVYMILRSAGIGPAGTLVAQGTLDDRERVILADFAAPPELEELAQTITEGVRIDLAQSPSIRLHQQRYVSAALDRMERPPDARLALELAREVAVREEIRAVVGGEIRPVGSGFVLTARVVGADDGAVLVSRRVTAGDADEIVKAVDELSKKLRERIGEPLVSIRRAEPLERVTTADLEALRRYSRAVQAIDRGGETGRGITLLEEAVRLDPDFAMAWRKLGVTLGNRSEERARAVEALTNAYEHRDRLTPREAALATASYHTMIGQDYGPAIEAYQGLLEREPDENTALNNLGHIYLQLRRWGPAEELFIRALEVDSLRTIPFINLIEALANQGEYEHAEALLDEYGLWLGQDPWVQEHAAHLALVSGDVARGERRLASLRETTSGDLYWNAQASLGLAAAAAMEGRLSEAEAHFRDAAATDERRSLPQAVLLDANRKALLDLWVRGDPARALGTLAEALGEHPLEEIDSLDRPYLPLATTYAAAGQAERARALLERYEAEVPAELRSNDGRIELERLKGAIALAEGDAARALEHTRASDRGECPICALPQLGRAHEAAGDADAAIEAYERYVATPYIWRVRDLDGWHLGPIHERLASLYEARGENGQAAEHYRALARLWAEADEELRPRVRAAGERLRGIAAER